MLELGALWVERKNSSPKLSRKSQVASVNACNLRLVHGLSLAPSHNAPSPTAEGG